MARANFFPYRPRRRRHVAMIDLHRASSVSRLVPGNRVYDQPLSTSFRYVPSLSFFCILVLARFPLDIHHIGPIRLNYRPPSNPHAFDLLRALCPPDSKVDPRLWATLVQIYDKLPPELSSYALPLGDEYLPLLQCIQCTTQFSLVTILELPGCNLLTDDSIAEFKSLHTLAALDITGTQISPAAIKTLSETLLWADPQPDGTQQRRGPWSLRVLCLKDCSQLNNAVLPHLLAFPALSVVDLRGTKCRIDPNYPYQPSNDGTLFHPTPIADALGTLTTRFATLHSSTNPHSFHIRTPYHLQSLKASPNVRPENELYVLPRSGRIIQRDSQRLQQVQEERDNAKARLNDGRPRGVAIQSSVWAGIAPPRLAGNIHSSYNDARVWTAVAGESDLLEARHAMLSFYSEPIITSKVTRALSSLTKEDVNDLTIYRDPPPWAELPTQPPKPVARTSLKPQVAKLNHRKMDEWKKASEHRTALSQIPGRDRILPLTNTALSNSRPPRNPFKRRASTGANLKELKPITSIEIPPLPQELRTPAKEKKPMAPPKSCGAKPNSSSRRPQSQFDWKGWSGKS
ncbi:hypothetical protein BDN72DRAFT_891505 [Pluteus cervinus]|uniref:Uncharacterized protein n=1 Tax=Pluteus cervinus TaxID=181527 RepID=A0ACD3BEZ0_9AGAR|nr:hypothetical protein BDN72DRAFT_891505 [Pluteus cervinus]